MDQATHNKIVSFIWGIADDVLRDLFKRGKYPDVILPMCVIRRLDAVLEPSKQAVLETKTFLDEQGITEYEAALCDVAGEAFYNTSKFTLKDLRSRGNAQQLRLDFENYLNGFSSNVQDIIHNFKFRNQLQTLEDADAIGTLVEKFLNPEINLSPKPVLNDDGSIRHPPMDNHSMGTIFEELVRRFNSENNEDAGEHWTPRDAVQLMANLIFLPIADQIESGAYLLYDGALGTGGMLTLAEETLKKLAAERGKQVTTHLYGQEINPETYAICKADVILRGKGDSADHIVGGAQWSTLSHDAFPAEEFDFMLSNPPYGKSWKKDLETLGGKDQISDPRFVVMHRGEELSLVTRSSDGQMLFLANMASKMNHDTPRGSRLAEVHNGSSLFTGDAGQGESNIRRWLMENDWVEAIVALPLNLFYNTGIATYIWVLSNCKPEPRRGKIQLIDATQWYEPLRKNLGKKNCKLSDTDIRRVSEMFLSLEESEQSKVFPNEAFGYWKITVERPLRLHSRFTVKAIETLRFASGDEELRREFYEQIGDALFENFERVRPRLEELITDWGIDEDDDEAEGGQAATKKIPEKKKKKLLDGGSWKRDGRLVNTAMALRDELSEQLFEDHNVFRERVNNALDKLNIRLTAAEKKLILRAVSWRQETAPPVIAKIHKRSKVDADPLYGRYAIQDANPTESCGSVVEYEADTELRDNEQIPLLEEGGIEPFFCREVLPYTPDAWIDESATKIGYEISFARHFYKPQPLRSLQEITADIVALENESQSVVQSLVNLVPV